MNVALVIMMSLFHPGPSLSVSIASVSPIVISPTTTTVTNGYVNGVYYTQTNYDSCLVGSRYLVSAGSGAFIQGVQISNTNILNANPDGTLAFVSPGSVTVRAIGVDANSSLSGVFEVLNSSSNLQQSTTYTFKSFDTNSLAWNVITGITAMASSQPSPSTANIWTTRDANATNFVRNPSCIARGLQGLSAIPAGHLSNDGGWWQAPMCAISPVHVYGVQHFHNATGATVFFVDSTNGVVTRQLIETTNVVSGSDITIGILDSPLPASIGFLKVLPTNGWTNYLPSAVYGYSTVGQFPGFKGATTGAMCLNQWQTIFFMDADKSVNSIVIPGLQQWFPGWGGSIVSGDSGSPILIPINGQLVILSEWTTSVSGTDLVRYSADVNDAMAKLSQRHGQTVYSLASVDLSGFGSY